MLVRTQIGWMFCLISLGQQFYECYSIYTFEYSIPDQEISTKNSLNSAPLFRFPPFSAFLLLYQSKLLFPFTTRDFYLNKSDVSWSIVVKLSEWVALGYETFVDWKLESSLEKSMLLLPSISSIDATVSEPESRQSFLSFIQ